MISTCSACIVSVMSAIAAMCWLGFHTARGEVRVASTHAGTSEVFLCSLTGRHTTH